MSLATGQPTLADQIWVASRSAWGRIRPDDEACTAPLANATPATDADPLPPFEPMHAQCPLPRRNGRCKIPRLRPPSIEIEPSSATMVRGWNGTIRVSSAECQDRLGAVAAKSDNKDHNIE